MTFQASFAIFSSVIVLRKLAKPVTGGEPAGLSLFLFQGDFTMPSQKTFLLLTNRFELLKSEKHLVITDETYAKDVTDADWLFSFIWRIQTSFPYPFDKKSIKKVLLLMKL